MDYWNVLNEFNLEQDGRIKMNYLMYHARGYHIIKQYSDKPVSSAHALICLQPYRPRDRWDQVMNELRDLREHEFFFHAIRTGELLYPERDAVYCKEVKDTVDFWSVNSYVRDITDARKADLQGKRYDFNHIKMIDKDFYLEEINPECLFYNLTRLTDKPVIITEKNA